MGVLRIASVFEQLKADNKSAFVAYVMAGDPDFETALEIVHGLPQAGADIIELGFPFSDPIAEGPSIQRASERALKSGTRTRDVFLLTEKFRATNDHTPIILMGYINPIEIMGYEEFAAQAKDCGADGVIVVDCPPEESEPLNVALKRHDLALIRLVTPTTDPKRLERVLKDTSGFVYYVSVNGVTGVKEANAEAIAPAVDNVRQKSGLPIAVGFGIRTPERAAEIAKIADATVVGSALVDEIALGVQENAPVRIKVLEKVRALAHAVHRARLNENEVHNA